MKVPMYDRRFRYLRWLQRVIPWGCQPIRWVTRAQLKRMYPAPRAQEYVYYSEVSNPAKW